jgi:hypothetical protein
MNYDEYLAQIAKVDSVLGAELGGLKNLDAILQWAPGAGITLASADLVQQDEYCYDFLLPLPDSRWLSFGVS